MQKHAAAVLTSATGTLLALGLALALMERRGIAASARSWWARLAP
jgi:hypothetical protein